jgi:hypothetical protein
MSQYGSQHFFKRPKIPKHAILNMLFGLSLAICLGHQASQEIPNKKATKAPKRAPNTSKRLSKNHIFGFCVYSNLAPKLLQNWLNTFPKNKSKHKPEYENENGPPG